MTAVDDRPEREPSASTAMLSRTATGRLVPSAADRARGALSGLSRHDRLVGWLAPVLITLIAFALRLVGLGNPARFAFDETYYAKDGWSLWRNGYVRDHKDDADGNPDTDLNADILDGTTTGLWTGDPSLTVHPDVGKWLIGLGETLFGMDPFGWRIMSAVAGALMVLVLIRLVRRMTGSTLLGCVAGVLLMLDGLHFVLSRLALLDIFYALFLLCGVACVVADRDWYRRRLARSFGDGGHRAGRWGPVRAVLYRPWLLTGGVMFGLACGTKWGAIWPLAGFGLLVWFWSAGARRSLGVRQPVLRSALADGLPAFGQLVVVAALTYVATWGGWLAHAPEYEEHLSSTQYTQFTGAGHCAEDEDSFVADDLDETARWPTATEPDATGPAEAWQSLRSLWYYHQDVYTFHANFLNCSTHTYESDPLGWPLLNRPVGVAVTNDIPPGEQGCDAAPDSDCIRQVLLIGTPVLWWGGSLALLVAGALWLGTRDWRFGVAVVGGLVTWLPWLLYDDRPIFLFYAIGMLPFLVIALTLLIGRLLGAGTVAGPARTAGVVVSGAYVILVLINFAWFWPIWTNGLLTHGEWLARIWFSRWI
ncbi:phospholipid carrier-dependent glycosyltransferase [Nocardioides panacisoli]|uniref:dolichyl-phosphate-mannose--protein mannosyltransferase n=1 Tax=Nocardioides panacisoli TaxID=627624 RepID=UPI001C639958|nr:phospholipid carrier-dependent glycosyltransferase [Nocardioides panacisoli]QYJ02779.1 phospholipid carrier-dependent glycosyltransferase [Nocardioides panacisoli]